MIGIGCVVEQKFSASRFMDRIEHFNATQTFALGAMSVFLMNTPEKEDDAENPLGWVLPRDAPGHKARVME